MTGEKGEQSGMKTATDRGRGGGQMNRDIVSRLVKRKQSRRGRLRESFVFMLTLETDSTETKQLSMKRESDRQKKERLGHCVYPRHLKVLHVNKHLLHQEVQTVSC